MEKNRIEQMLEPILNRAAVRALDRRAIEEYGIASLVLMENAGRAAAFEALEMLAGSSGSVLVLCGPGNNGGDGLVVARTLANHGLPVRTVFVGSAARLETGSADFRKNLALWRGLGLGVDVVETEVQASDLGRAVQAAALVVDALFGTGLERPLDQPWKAAIEAVNASGRPVLAVDLPSGLDADSGAALGALVRATATVTFVAKKPGLTRGLGREAAGRVRVAEIGIPRGWLGAGVTAE